jgi:hypothetical protein
MVDEVVFWVSSVNGHSLHIYEDCIRKFRRQATQEECLTMDLCGQCNARRVAERRAETKRENVAARAAILAAMPPTENGNRAKVTTTVYLEAQQIVRLRERAAIEGETVASLIRKSVDTYLGADHGSR